MFMFNEVQWCMCMVVCLLSIYIHCLLYSSAARVCIIYIQFTKPAHGGYSTFVYVIGKFKIRPRVPCSLSLFPFVIVFERPGASFRSLKGPLRVHLHICLNNLLQNRMFYFSLCFFGGRCKFRKWKRIPAKSKGLRQSPAKSKQFPAKSIKIARNGAVCQWWYT